MVERAEVIQAPSGPAASTRRAASAPALRGVLPLVGPVILSSLTEVEERSLALEVRAFGRPGPAAPALADPGQRRAARRPRVLAARGPRRRDRPPAHRHASRRLPCDAPAARASPTATPGYAREVLHDIDLALDDGEIVGLVGPNEAGKSTLCLVASGLAPASIGGDARRAR